MKLRPKKPARENASRLLPRLAHKFFRAGDRSIEDELTGEDLHRFRILAKRFRYALEFFRPCYGSALDAHLESLRELQALLGDLNDCCASRGRFRDLLAASGPSKRHKALLKALDDLESDLLERYRALWRDSWEPPGFRQRFLRYLAHPPRQLSELRAGARRRPEAVPA